MATQTPVTYQGQTAALHHVMGLTPLRRALKRCDAEIVDAEIQERMMFFEPDERAPQLIRENVGSAHEDLTQTRQSFDFTPGRDVWSFDPTGRSVTDTRAAALTAVERYSSNVPDTVRERATAAIEQQEGPEATGLMARWATAAGDPAYERAFGKVLVDPMSGHLEFDDAEREAWQRAKACQRAMNEGTTGAGLAMVPVLIDPAVAITNDGAIDPMRQIATVRTIASKSLKLVSSEGVVSSWDGEAAETSDDSPTLVQPEVTTHKLQCFVPFSIELEGDVPSLMTELGRLMMDEFMVREAEAFWTGAGDGSNQPYGIVTALDANTNVEISMATNGEFHVEDVYTAIEALPPRFRPNASWAMALENINRIRQFAAGGADDASSFLADLGAGQPPLLVGKPLYEASSMSGVLSTAGVQNSVIVADFARCYTIVDRVGAQVELVNHLFATANNRPTGQRGLYAWKRVGADSINDKAAILLQNASS